MKVRTLSYSLTYAECQAFHDCAGSLLGRVGHVRSNKILINSSRKWVETRRHRWECSWQGANNKQARKSWNSSSDVHHVVRKDLIVFFNIAVKNRITFCKRILGKDQQPVVDCKHLDKNVSDAENPASFLRVAQFWNCNKSLNTFWSYANIRNPHCRKANGNHPEGASKERIWIDTEMIIKW